MSAPISLFKQFIPPGGGANIPYGFVTHARELVGSVSGQPATEAVYAIVDNNGLELIEYKQVAPGLPANYVDGVFIAPESPVPANTGTFPGWPILDQPIMALANPYDQEDYATTGIFNQFHCLYQYTSVSGAMSKPLLIIRGDDNGAASPDTRLVLTKNASNIPINDPDGMWHAGTQCWYVAAVNQMGIHVHWHAIDLTTGMLAHFYARDMNRAFDEDIDENTLVTDQ